ncbi:MAG: MBL fold metallo-hydrolase [Hydrogenophaga sp.]|uniref:MBL fold metallo-hydrolase n=1 Tax=Hydrogenophaga sp. TaxID=1904254 RepID=UPI0027252BD6|nr:MBL fold metallo-hydrolase [Hydrogenophaga sp.]MDO9480097.1 MBL fold metallo-hydrolase [Hydrogenophaga sp.]MDP3343942.1 MBL fold metallo-hydrolase [Hydrogenophaga sp.]MDP3805649.1 MBL fold metallo-hydrolase [Hydrogenophaga sp.]
MQPDKEQLEARLHYPLGQALPEPGRALGVAPGVKWLRMALPFALDHINLWLLRDTQDGREGWTAVDCCIAHDAAKAQWDRVFEHALESLPILRVVVTHMHPDHIGLAHWLCQRWTTAQHDCHLWISATDHAIACTASQSTTGFGGETAAAFFASQGLTDADQLAQIRGRASYYPNLVPAVPRQYHRLMDGGQLTIGGRAWQCISGYGHAPEHIALHCPELGVLISGDMVLPRISTNVSVYDQEPEADALTLFLDSLDKFLPLPAATLVLPSHGKPFTGLHERIQQLKDHHADRLAEVLQACQAQPCSAADILPVMFKRPLDLHQTTFAMGEAVAHLHRLWHGGQLVRSRGVDGVFRFRTA